MEYYGQDLEQVAGELLVAEVTGGKALVELSPPTDAVAMTVNARSGEETAQLALQASYSPSGNFIHVEQTGDPLLEVGRQADFRVHSTSEARNFYYEVLSRGRVIYSGMARTPEIAFQPDAGYGAVGPPDGVPDSAQPRSCRRLSAL